MQMAEFRIESLINMSMFLIPPFLAWIIYIYLLQHGNMSRRRKLAFFFAYLILVNACTFSISYARGVKRFDFGHMTTSYRLKYMGLGCVLGLVPSVVIMIYKHSVSDSKMQSESVSVDTHLGRYCNFDLLKIISMAMIILFHYCHGEWNYSSMGGSKVIIDIIWMFGELGVNLFALISGYFMVEQTNPFRAKKVVLMWLQVLFYSVLSLTIAYKMGILEINQEWILHTIFPITYRIWWYASAYIVLYFLAPFINKGLKAIGKKEYGRLIFILLAIFSVLPTFMGIFNNDTEVFLYYNRFIWITILYCTAGYIKIYGIYRDKWTSIHWGVSMLLCGFCSCCLSFLCQKMESVNN